MQIPDFTFRQLLNVVDCFGSNRIRVVAISAAPVLDLFMDGSVVTPRLQIKNVADGVLGLLPRAPRDMRSLFATVRPGVQGEDLLVDYIPL